MIFATTTTTIRRGAALAVCAAGLMLAPVTPALAGPTAEQKCEGGKVQTAGKYAACASSAEKVLLLKGDAVKYAAALAKCSDKLGLGYDKLESKGGCSTMDDAVSVEAFMASCTLSVTGALSDGTPLPDLAACTSCASDLGDCEDALAAALGAGLPATFQTNCYDAAGLVIACAGTGQDGEFHAGQARSFNDNGDGTITDNVTGLIWEKLDDNNVSGIHDYTRGWTWDNAFRKVRVLNGDATACIGSGNPDTCCTGAGTGTCSPFAGHSDWRLPNVMEMFSLVSFATFDPTVSAEFNTACTSGCTTATCSCTASSFIDYWTSTASLDDTTRSRYVGFYNGNVAGTIRGVSNGVRAVRGGL